MYGAILEFRKIFIPVPRVEIVRNNTFELLLWSTNVTYSRHSERRVTSYLRCFLRQVLKENSSWTKTFENQSVLELMTDHP